MKTPKTYWGYVLTMGSTEGNMYGMYSAREYLEGMDTASLARGSSSEVDQVAYQMNRADGKEPMDCIIFYSDNSHYSIAKAARICNVKTFGSVANE